MSAGADMNSLPESKGWTWKRVWDLPVRLFHWLLVICVCASWYIGDNRSFDNIQWHFYLGYCVGGLIVFRLIWGMIGPPSARISALFYGPRSIIKYARTTLRRSPSGTAGHNPLGSWSVIALLTSLALQVITGLFAYDDGLFSGGPLTVYVSEAAVLQMNYIHGINANILLALVTLHVFAAFFYLFWKRENLISAMITGRKLVRINQDDITADKSGKSE